MRRTLLTFLYSNKNIVGSVLGLGALGLYFAGIIHNFWWEIVFGSYGIGWLATPANQSLETDLNQQMDAAEVSAALDKLTHDLQGRVTPDIAALMESIKQSILAILPTIAKSGTQADPNVYNIRETALDYLPKTLQNYVALPPAFRGTYPIQNGKTATTLLKEQLTLLDAKMKEIVQNLLANNTQALVANGNFLRDKFKTQDFLTPV
jgi:hypothetical protein